MRNFPLTLLVIIIAISSCEKGDNPDAPVNIYFEDFEDLENLDDWEIYVNSRGYKTAGIDTSCVENGVGNCLYVSSFTWREMGQTDADLGRATKYIGSVVGNGIYTLSLKLKVDDDGPAWIKLQHIRSGEIVSENKHHQCCESDWINFSLADTLDVSPTDSLAIVLEKGFGFMSGSNPAKFDSIQLIITYL